MALNVLLAGVHGHGQVHLRNIARLRDSGGLGIRLAGVCDPRPLDGALTNPFAHAVATVLALADSAVTCTETDLYHVNDIEPTTPRACGSPRPRRSRSGLR